MLGDTHYSTRLHPHNPLMPVFVTGPWFPPLRVSDVPRFVSLLWCVAINEPS